MYICKIPSAWVACYEIKYQNVFMWIKSLVAAVIKIKYIKIQIYWPCKYVTKLHILTLECVNIKKWLDEKSYYIIYI